MKKNSIILLIICFVLMACERTAPPADVIHYGVSGGTSQGVIQIYKGDTLYTLSKLYRVPLQDLITVNNIRPPYTLNIGQRLIIPEPRTYVVKAGDSYSSIARLFDLSLTELVRLNQSKPPHYLKEGQRIFLSKSKKSPLQQVVRKTASEKKRPVVSQKRVQSIKKQSKINLPPPRAGGKFSKPIFGKTISSYGAKKGGLFNDGINIVAPRGTPVRSSETGVVAYVGNDLKGFGNLILVKHTGGYMTAYAHMENTLVKRGENVTKGQSIGTVGSTGNVTSPQLHFEIRKNGRAVDPKQYL